ncbi:MAG: GNVR domain-containing protein, partial [Gemmobacter sp.]
YNQAVSRRASAQTGDLIETLSKGGRISIIEQAVVPREPTSPNRPLIAAAGVGGGIAAGLGLVLLLELMNSAIHRPADITGKLGITPFATLPLIRTRRDQRRRRMILTLAFGLVLLGIPLGLWAVQSYFMPLDLLLQKVLSRFNLAEAVPALSAIPVLPV